ncbi:hypothetical protein PENSPDRAFT_759532 [Peniophora sp. CONT]|nr:hypothetical protein PENSPDRAFT_759532 [Peniophora sp. CONT]
MKAATNGLLSCEACCKFLASPDGHNDERLSVLIPCLPILNYVNHVIRNVLGEDVDSLRQTVDQILDDLAKDPSLTPERRAAAPFLHCYQLQPTSRRGGTLPKEFLRVSLYDPPASTVINGRSYRILDPASTNERLSRTMDLPVYEQTSSHTTVTLWCIRQRPVGYFTGCVASLGLPEIGDLQLRKTFLSIFSVAKI